MENQRSLPSPNSTQNHTNNKPISSYLGSPRFLNGLLTRSLSDTETIKTSQFQTSRSRLYDVESVTSQNSILDGMQNLNLRNPFGYDRKPPNPISNKHPNNKLESKTIKTTTRNMPHFQTSRGPLNDTESSIIDGMQNLNLGNPLGYDRKLPNPITKKPPNNKLESESIGLALIDPIESSGKIPVLFGAKLKVEIPCSIEVKNTCGNFGEMESSEDYTCVITHGPNPRTTHIFDNCIVESFCGFRKLSELVRDNSCNSCKVDHTERKDI